MLGGILGRIGGSILGGAGSWLLGKVGNFAKKVFGGFGTKQSDTPSPITSAVRTLGPFVTRGIGEDNFKNTMRKFGGFIDEKINGTALAPVKDGTSVGDMFYNGMQKAFNYMKNGGVVQQNATMGGTGDAVEKGAPPSQTENQQTTQMAAMNTNYY